MKTYAKRLYRSTDNRVIFGVMGGLGEYFDVDPVVFRVAYTAFTCFTGVAPGVLAYLLMAIFMPKAPSVITAKAESVDK